MPDYIPPINLSEGLAQERVRLAASRPSPWAALAQAVAQGGQTALGGLEQMRAQQRAKQAGMATPEEMKAFGLTENAPGPLQPGQEQITQTMAPIRLQSAENLLQRKTQQDIARESTERMVQAGNLRAGLTDVPVNAMHKAQFKTVYGTDIPFDHLTQAQEKQLAAQYAEKIKPPPTSSGAGNGLQVDKFVQTEMDKSNRLMNPMVAPRGAPLGNAGMMKTRIATAREALNDPNITPQQLNSVTTDLAGIVQMGSPHETGIRDQNYQTWWTQLKALSGKITNEPKTADSPETVKKLKDILNGYDKTYNKFVNNNLDAHKASVKTLLNKYPAFKEAYEETEKQIRSQYPIGNDVPGGSSSSGADKAADYVKSLGLYNG